MPIMDLFLGGVDPWAEKCDPLASEPLWLRPTRPNSRAKYGALPRTAAYIAAHFDEGDIITLKELISNVPDNEGLMTGESRPNLDTQYQRRFRQLRDFGWKIKNSLEDRSLEPGQYRLTRIGQPLWIPGQGEARNPRVPPRVAQAVFERDGNRCILCGYGAGESYEDGSPVQLRAGHRIPGARRGKPTEENLRTECARCNDAIRDERPDPVTLDEVWPAIRRQPKREKDRILEWLLVGQKTRTEPERLYDRARYLSPSERRELIERLGH
ncbi:HNH endonuclease [Prauserella sp. PE36]|uniref:HNH endonuclease n=1 Tax=Prauserella sp. PE36 TaxID=1504709 RepID=UPI0026B6ED34